jgi:hypothetical protein
MLKKKLIEVALPLDAITLFPSGQLKNRGED